MGLTKEGLKEKYQETAVKQVKRQLILGRIIEQEEMTLSDEDQENGFKEMADNFNQPIDQIKKYYKENAENLEFFKHALLEKNAITLIIESSDIEDVEPELQSEPKTEK